MNLQTAKLLIEAGDELYLNVKLSENYSGRGMYGRETTGIIVDNKEDIFALISSLIGDLTFDLNFYQIDDEVIDIPAIREDISNLKIDNMGRSYIYY